MKGVSYLTDSKNRRKALVIDIKSIIKNDEKFHDLIDAIVAESRLNEPKFRDWKEAKKELKAKGKR